MHLVMVRGFNSSHGINYLCETRVFLSLLIMDSNNLIHCSIEKWNRMQMNIYLSSKQTARKGLKRFLIPLIVVPMAYFLPVSGSWWMLHLIDSKQTYHLISMVITSLNADGGSVPEYDVLWGWKMFRFQIWLFSNRNIICAQRLHVRYIDPRYRLKQPLGGQAPSYCWIYHNTRIKPVASLRPLCCAKIHWQSLLLY